MSDSGDDDDVELDFVAYVRRFRDELRSEKDPEALRRKRVVRDFQGRFVKGTPSPNPNGRPRMEQRMFGMTQAVKDGLQLFDQPVRVVDRNGGRKQQMPAIVAIHQAVIRKAIAGDWRATRFCLELHARYSAYREKTLVDLLGSAQQLRGDYREAGQEMPDNVRELVELVEKRALEGQYRSG